MVQGHREIVLGDAEGTESAVARDLALIGAAVSPGATAVLPSVDEANDGPRLVEFRVRLLLGIAGALNRHGGFRELAPLFDRAVRVAEEGFGAVDPLVATALREQASYLLSDGETTAAAALYQRAVTVYRATLPPGHPDLATALHALALIYDGEGRADEARALWAEARTALDGPGRSGDGMRPL